MTIRLRSSRSTAPAELGGRTAETGEQGAGVHPSRRVPQPADRQPQRASDRAAIRPPERAPQPIALLQEPGAVGGAARRHPALVFDHRGAHEDGTEAEHGTAPAEVDVLVVEEPAVVETARRAHELGRERDRSAGEQLERFDHIALDERRTVVDVGPGTVRADPDAAAVHHRRIGPGDHEHRLRGADLRRRRQRIGQRSDPPRPADHVVVEQHDDIGARREGALEPGVRGRAVAVVRDRDHLDRIVDGIVGRDLDLGAAAGVDDDDPVDLAGQRREATPEGARWRVVRDDHCGDHPADSTVRQRSDRAAAMSETYHARVDPDAPNNPHSIALRFVGRDRRVLEIGCWSGHVTEHLVAAGNRVVGVEVDGGAAELARAFADRVHVLDLDIVRLSAVETERFDVILLGDVLEHFRDPTTVLADLVTLLEPDGRLVISVPHVGHIDVRLHLLEGRWDYQRDGLLDRTHLRWFTRASLRELLTAVGFVAVQLDPVVHELGASQLPVAPALRGTDVERFVRADPDALIYQFVVEAVRRDELGDRDDALAPVAATFPDLGAEAAARDEETTALRNEVEAWRRSRLVRATEPFRRVRAALSRGRP